jgi:hypothetical protein
MRASEKGRLLNCSIVQNRVLKGQFQIVTLEEPGLRIFLKLLTCRTHNRISILKCSIEGKSLCIMPLRVQDFKASFKRHHESQSSSCSDQTLFL